MRMQAETSRATEPPVVLIAGDFPPVISGVGDYSARLAEALGRHGHRVTVVTSCPEPGASDGWQAPGVTVRREAPGWRLRHLPHWLRLAQPLAPGTILHLQYWCPSYRRNLAVNLLPGLLRLAHRGCPVAVTVHGFRLQSWQWRMRALPMLLSARGVLFVDAPDRELIERWSLFNRPLMRCVPIGSNIQPVPVDAGSRDSWRRSFGLAQDAPVAVFFGELHVEKGILQLAEAVRRVRAGGTPVQLLVVCGSKSSVSVADVIGEGLQAGWTRVLTDLPAAQVSRALHAADVAVFPFLHGASSNRGSLLAALAHGLPTITTDGAATPPDFGRHFGVRLVPAGDVTALAASLQQLLQSSQHAADLRSKALAASRRLSWDQIASDTSQFYRSLLARPSPATMSRRAGAEA